MNERQRLAVAFLAGTLLAGTLLARMAGAGAAERVKVDQVRIAVDNLVLTDREVDSLLRLESQELRRQYSGDELQRRLDELTQTLTDRMVEDLLLEDRAQKLGIQVDEKEINQRVDAIVARDPTVATTYTDEELKSFIVKDILKRQVMQREVNAYVHASEEQIREACQAEARDNREVHVGHILLRGQSEEALNRISVIRDKLEGGASFDQTAVEYSEDPSVTKNRGDLGFISRGQFVREFEAMAFAMKPGEISPPVKTQFGYHLIKVFEERTKAQLDCNKLDEVNRSRFVDQVYQRLRDERMKEYIAKLKKQAVIKVFDRK